MSASQLREVFHVDHVNSVPHYELVTLTHHNTAQHVRKKRSIDSGPPSAIAQSDSLSSLINSSSSTSSGRNSNLVGNNHHVKKDLSKTPYSDKLNSVFDEKKPSKSDLKFDKSGATTPKNVYSDVKLSDISEHKVSFDAFGANLNLTLHPTEGLFQKGPQMLKMWHALPNPNATDGIDYRPIKWVSQLLNFRFLNCSRSWPCIWAGTSLANAIS